MGAVEILDRLFEPVTLRGFIDEYWPTRVLYQHGDLARVGPLRELPQLNDVGKLFEASREVSLFFTDDRGNQMQATLPAAHAARVYAAGMTALVNSLHHTVPLLGEVVRALEEHAGVPPGSCDAMAHLSRPGHGLVAHFDNQDVITLQIRGRKRWVISDPDVASPTVNFSSGSPVVGDLKLYWDGTRKPPEPSTQTVVLEPGSALFVPRGFWHTTEALEESLSLTLGFSTQTWADLLVSHLRRKLIASPQWREPVLGGFAGPDAPSTARARARLTELLPRWLEDVGRLAPDDLLPQVRRFGSVPEVMAAMTKTFRPEAATNVRATFLFRFHGDTEAPFFAAVADGKLTVQRGDHRAPDLTLTAEPGDFLRLMADIGVAQQLVRAGKLAVQPFDRERMVQLTQLFGMLR